MRRRDLLLSLGPLWASRRAAAQPVGGKEVVVIGAENDWYPYSAERGGHAEGLTVDLVRAAFAAAGLPVRFEVLPYARCMAETRRGGLVACFNTTRTSLIEHDYLWPARPMFEERFLIYARADDLAAGSGLKVKDLEGQAVAVTRGYEYGSEFDANPRVERVVTNHDENNFRVVLRGRARFTLAPEINTRLLFERFPELAGQFRVAGQFELFGLYTAFSTRHPDAPRVLAAFDAGMRTIQANGVARAIHARWRHGPP